MSWGLDNTCHCHSLLVGFVQKGAEQCCAALEPHILLFARNAGAQETQKITIRMPYVIVGCIENFSSAEQSRIWFQDGMEL